MANNFFYVKIPFRSDFSLREGNILQNQKQYGNLWQQIRHSDINVLPGGNKIDVEYLHDAFEEDEMQFESVNKDSSLNDAFSPVVLQITPLDWFEKVIEEQSGILYNNCFGTKEEKRVSYEPHSCKITLYKNTLSTIEFIFRISLENKQICPDCIEKLEKWSNEFAASIVDYSYQKILVPFMEQLRTEGEKYNFFCESGNHMGFPDVYEDSHRNRIIKRSVRCGVPLWVSRSLIIGKRDEHFDQLVNRWVIATQNKDEILEKFRNEEGDEKNHIYLGWMHSMMLGDINDKVIRDAFFALGLAQYYYAIFDSLNQSLSQIIGISHKKRSMNNTKNYKKLLEDMIFITDLIKINYSDITQGLQRNRAYFFRVIVRQWTIDNIMENVHKKIALCKDNINKIYQKAFNRSQKVAELLLFFISGFAILEFLKGISEFFYGPDSIQTDIWGLYNVGQMVGPNTMMWFGMVLFLIVFLIYFKILKAQD
ncbi:MAG: hypothetical protein R6T99_11035 [Bacteroidales bacterium]